ncbi:MAG: adenylate/guanylate cyclase domain-containing protein [Nitrospirota bacterium]
MGEDTPNTLQKFRLSKPLILGLFIGIIGVLSNLLPFGTELEEDFGLKVLFGLRGVRPVPSDSDIVIVDIDEESADKFGIPEDPRKWPRSLHAHLVDNLSGGGAAVIVFDVNFLEQQSSHENMKFAGSIRKAGNVVLCDSIEIEQIPVTNEKGSSRGLIDVARITKPIPVFSEAALASAPFPIPKTPHKVSQFWTFKTIAGDTPTLPVVAFQVFTLPVYDEFIRILRKINPEAGKLPEAREEIKGSGEFSRLIHDVRMIFQKEPRVAAKMKRELKNMKDKSVAAKQYQQMSSLIEMYERKEDSRYLNYYGPARTFQTVPYYEIFRDGEKDARLFDVRGKAVFVGLSASSPTDKHESYYSVFSQKGIDLSGVEIVATAFANLLEGRSVMPLDFRLHLAIIFIWGMMAGAICRKYRVSVSSLSVAVLGSFYLLFSVYQFKNSGAWFPIVIPLLFQTPIAVFAGVLLNYADMKKERQIISKAFGYYLPASIVDRITKNIDNIHASHQVMYGICLYTDAEQYSALAESMDPEDLAIFMNKYYETLFKPVKEHGGDIANVIGDSMLAMWVASHPHESMRREACLAALDVARAIEKFNLNAQPMKLPTRIALHSGHIVLGNIGALDHYEYRPIGDIVNTVTRLERLNKSLHVKILASGEIIDHLDGFPTREIGDFRLAGKSRPVHIYEITGSEEESIGLQERAFEMFSKGLDAYRNQLWDEAIERFKDCDGILRGDGPSRFYIGLCEKEKNSEHRRLWDGVVSLEK